MNGTVQRTWWGGRKRVEERAIPAPENANPVLFDAAPIGPNVTPTSALAIADVYAAVRCLSDAAASLPLVAYRRTSAGRTRADGALADLLRRPAPATTQANLIGQAMAHLQLYGNVFFGKFRGADGRVEQLALLHPDRVTVELKAGQPQYTVNDGLGRQSEHGVEDVIHVRALGTDGLLGLSPVRQCRLALGLSQSLSEHAASFFENGARPSGVLTVPEGMLALERGERESQLGQLREDLTNVYAGTRNAHKIAVMSGGMEWTPLGAPLDDLQFVQQRRMSTADVARIFRIPPHMLGASSGDSMTYSNVESQSLAFVNYSVRPWLVLIEQAISEDADLCPGPLYVEFLLDALLRADSMTRSAVYTAGLNAETGWLTRAEVRRLENLDPEPETATPSTTEMIA